MHTPYMDMLVAEELNIHCPLLKFYQVSKLKFYYHIKVH
jgi:hypothetical protein